MRKTLYWMVGLIVATVLLIGCVSNQDLFSLDYKRINRPMFPLDKDMEDPDLSATFIQSSNEIMR